MSGKRVYRKELNSERLTSFRVTVKETDLWIAVNSASYDQQLPQLIEQYVWGLRRQLEQYLAAEPAFAAALGLYLVGDNAPPIAREMAVAANRVGVGPMAAVAGAFAQSVGLELLNCSPEVIVENGGDVFLKVDAPVLVGIHAGSSALSDKLALQVDPEQTPLGVCTSSGSVGPSYSAGKADAAVVVAESASLADAAATALGNSVSGPEDLEKAFSFMPEVEGICGGLLIYADQLAAWGRINLKKTGSLRED